MKQLFPRQSFVSDRGPAGWRRIGRLRDLRHRAAGALTMITLVFGLGVAREEAIFRRREAWKK